MKVNLEIGFSILKMKCTQYGLYGQAAFKNARANLFLKVGRSRKGARASSGQWRRRAWGGAQPWANVI